MALPAVSVQGDYVGFNSGNGEKLSYNQEWLCLAAAKFLSIFWCRILHSRPVDALPVRLQVKGGSEASAIFAGRSL